MIITHGVHGFEEHMKEVARRFAVLGYTCIVPALYCRDGFLTVVEEEDLAVASASLSVRLNAQTIGDLAGSLAFLQNWWDSVPEAGWRLYWLAIPPALAPLLTSSPIAYFSRPKQTPRLRGICFKTLAAP